MPYHLRLPILCAALFLGLVGLAQTQAPKLPYEQATWGQAETELDRLVRARLMREGLQPAMPCSEEVFLRRVYLDVIGTLPDAAEVRQYQSGRPEGRRGRLIDQLLARDEFADYWTLKWADVLRLKSEFPINLWPNAVQAYEAWLNTALRTNMPLDEFARTLLTSSGSNFRVGPANFYRAVPGRTPVALAGAAALAFMGTRIESWPEAQRRELAVFFSRVKYKQTQEWKEEVVYSDYEATATLNAILPDSTRVQLKPGDDPREAFAQWLLKPGNPWFARAMANRVWAWLMGRGIIHEPDDIRPDNPAVNPELLAYLEKELVRSKYDMRALFRVVLNSQTYQQSSFARGADPRSEALFAVYAPQRLDAEVLIDAIGRITATSEVYTSMIPEPYTVIPGKRTITLADGSISSPFLELFGRPARDSGLVGERQNQATSAQCLYLFNSGELHKRIQGSKRLAQFVQAAHGDSANLVRLTYLNVLTRQPTAEELKLAQEYFQARGVSSQQAEDDLVWALINSREFLFRH